MLQVQTLDYRLGSFVNLTLTALKGINEELTALRMMELQDRTVLDQLTAAAGGVCAIVGTSCCTFIPKNEGDEGIINQAIRNLTQLRDAMDADFKPQQALFEWLTTGTWYQILLKIMTPVLVVLLPFCVLVTCVLPCLRAVVRRMIGGSMDKVLMTGVEEAYIQIRELTHGGEEDYDGYLKTQH